MRSFLRPFPIAVTAILLLAACTYGGTSSPPPPPVPQAPPPPPVIQPSSSSETSLVPLLPPPARSSERAVVPPPAVSSQASRQASSAIPKPKPQAASVTIQNFAFSPATLRVSQGTTVTWVNRDSAPHQIDADEKFPSGPVLSQGQSYSYTFAATGTFPYYCAIHPSMRGSVEVVP